jgi:hypothetical protein
MLRLGEVLVATLPAATAAARMSGLTGGAVFVRIRTSMREQRFGDGFTTIGKWLEPLATPAGLGR